MKRSSSRPGYFLQISSLAVFEATAVPLGAEAGENPTGMLVPGSVPAERVHMDHSATNGSRLEGTISSQRGLPLTEGLADLEQIVARTVVVTH